MSHEDLRLAAFTGVDRDHRHRDCLPVRVRGAPLLAGAELGHDPGLFIAASQPALDRDLVLGLHRAGVVVDGVVEPDVVVGSGGGGVDLDDDGGLGWLVVALVVDLPLERALVRVADPDRALRRGEPPELPVLGRVWVGGGGEGAWFAILEPGPISGRTGIRPRPGTH